MKKFLIVAILALLTTACSNRLSNDEWKNQVEAKVKEWQLQSIPSITTFTLDSWSSLGDRFLIISTSPFKPYLIELNARCPGLDFANAILTDQSTSTSLSARFDSITPGNSPGIPCQISKIYPLTKDQGKALKSLENKE
ncbi:DUF6491 family protein [Shewanella submarina]|uniref:DUF6491 family protein n=1 Tax=Shewanella submarina TaxID=2016376 RepID=A0ABV7G903_9GAMM|nr:DUF6491 family protein [Shewanella submarina]MCL1038541.1 DUF6491 family protein [Shewanella submarina]